MSSPTKRGGKPGQPVTNCFLIMSALSIANMVLPTPSGYSILTVIAANELISKRR
jgi:hypothetical protein